MLRRVLFIFLCCLLAACANRHDTDATGYETSVCKKSDVRCYKQNGKHYNVMSSSKNYQEKGYASWYGRGFNKKRTSSGERYNMYHMTAAHKTLPLDTYVRVTNLANGRTVVVKVNDRGPFVSNRLIDVSYAAAKKLGMVGRGTTPVTVTAI